jgi:hypothetical protein
VLPLSLAVRVLLRMNRRFYDSDASYVKNVFSLVFRDMKPTYFTRLLILRWLAKRFSQQGSGQLKGYFQISRVVGALAPLGIEQAVVLREVEYLAKAQCVISEDFRVDRLGLEELIRLGPAGFVHLELLENPDYLAAVAEDTFFDDEERAKGVADRIRKLDAQFELGNTIANAREVLSTLESARAVELTLITAVLQDSEFAELSDLANARHALDSFEIAVTARPWQGVSEKYRIGAEVTGRIVNVREFGVFVELEPGVTGLIHASKLPPDFQSLDYLDSGERVVVCPLNIDPIKARMGLRFVRAAPYVPPLAE